MKGRFITLLRESLSGLRDLFFTRTCAVCGGTPAPDGPAGHLLCERCLGDIPLTYFWTYSENAALDTLASRCHVYNAAALFFYRHGSPYCEIVRQFKYGRRLSLGLWAARLLGEKLASAGLYSDVEAVVPVPLHWFKRWRRGFNQAEIIASGVAERLGGLSVVPHLMRRRRYTSTQTRKSVSSRRENVAGAFAISSREVERLRAAGVKHLLLVDDVLTTGSTLSECVRLLEPYFTVSVATLGFVG